jgi:hypothetical protein
LNQPSSSLHLQVFSGFAIVASAAFTKVATRVSHSSHASVEHLEQAPKRDAQA